MNARNPRRRANGFTLIEVLIAILVISTGMLGFAAVQAVSINNTAVARYQSLAAIEVSSLAASMQANAAYWENLGVAKTICIGVVNGTAVTNEVNAGSKCPVPLTGGAGSLNTQSSDCTASACTPTGMAAFDLKAWASALSQVGAFAQPEGTVSCSAAGTTPVSCLVTLSWTEKNVALSSPKGSETGALANGQTVRNSYSQVVQP